MLFFRGCRPEIQDVLQAQNQAARRGSCIALLFTSLCLAIPAQAQQGTPLTLTEAEDLALEQEPGQAAFLARADALEERSVAVGQLPDPKLRMGLANFPIESGRAYHLFCS